MKKPADEIAALREEIAEHDHLYFVEGNPRITDREYDRLFARLKELEAAHPERVTPDSPTQRVGDKPLDGFPHVTHAVPMMSIDNTYNEAELREFDARVRRGLEGAKYEYLVDPKVDGVSATLRYENGRFVLGATRGDGRTGDDITANLRTIRAIPLRLRGSGWPDVLEVRGEVYWPRKAFDAFNVKRIKEGEEPFANPRNATTGSLKSLDSAAIAGRGLSFIAHGHGEIRYARSAGEVSDFSGSGGQQERASVAFARFRDWGIPVSPHMKLCKDIDEVVAFVHGWEHKRHALEYETDGLVIKVDRLDQREILGATSRYPRWCIAYKYAAEQAESVLKSVDFQVGKLGTITPRAVMEPVQLSGTTVRHASLHNFDQVARLDVRIGDTVVVEKAGEIIPQVVRVVVEKRPKGARKIEPPKKCPVCGGDVVQDEGGVYVRCVNPSCDAQLKERLKFFCGRDQMDIDGLGEVIIEKMVDAGWLHSYADIYKLPQRRAQIVMLEIEQQRTDAKTGEVKTGVVQLGEKRADKIIEGIEKSKKQPLARVLAALNIRHVGASTAEVIADHFGDMERIAGASEDELQEVEGVGPEVAASLRSFFGSVSGRKAWQALRDAGVNMKQPRRRVTGAQPLAGKTIVVTGTLEKYSRSEIEKLIKDLGGKVSSSVSKKTDFLICGEDPGSKLEKARVMGVKIMSEQDILAFAASDA